MLDQSAEITDHRQCEGKAIWETQIEYAPILPTKINRQIDRAIEARVREYAQRSVSEITCHINKLDREWDMERLLETNASAVAFTGPVLGMTHSRSG